MCCGRRTNQQVAIPPEAVQGESVLVRYTGNKRGTFQVHGRATGTDYFFNSGSQAVQVVDQGDASYILSLPHYVLA